MSPTTHPKLLAASADVLTAAGLPTLAAAFMSQPGRRPACLRMALATLTRRGGAYAEIAARWRDQLVTSGQI